MSCRKASKYARLTEHPEVLVPTLIYGGECWIWQKKPESRFNVVEMRALGSMAETKEIAEIGHDATSAFKPLNLYASQPKSPLSITIK